MYKFIFYVPVDYSESVKQAVFDAGAGQLDGYSHCSFETLGKGQFRPGNKSRPFLGSSGELEYVEELKVETLCQAKVMKNVLAAFRKAHPYEVPAFDIIELVEGLE